MKILALSLFILASSQACSHNGECDSLILSSDPQEPFGQAYYDAWGRYTRVNTTDGTLKYAHEFDDYYISSDLFVSF